MDVTRFPKPMIHGHRGCRAVCPENTMAAFAAGIAAGADMIEMDLRLSADAKVVVIHDATVDRTTDGSGAVEALTWPRLRALDAGSWFNPAFAGQRIPLLEEVLARFGGRIGLHLELKTEGGATRPEDLVAGVLAVVERFDVMATIVFSSFNVKVLECLRRQRPSARLALITRRGADAGDMVQRCRDLEAIAWHAHFTDLTAATVGATHGAGLQALAYTVNEPAEFARLAALGVDGVFSDDPGLIRRCLT